MARNGVPLASTDAPPKMGEVEKQLKAFVRDAADLVAALIAAFPIVTDYLGIVPAPGTGSGTKALGLMASLTSALAFLFVFWTRDRWENFPSAALGLALALAGFSSVFESTKSNLIDYAPFLYVGGFFLTSLGTSLTVMYGFTRSRERRRTLMDVIPLLDGTEWNNFLRLARSQASLHGTIDRLKVNAVSKTALKGSAVDMLSNYSKVLENLAAGTLEIRGPAMDDIYGHFLDGVTSRFKALSKDDLDYWSDPDSSRYLDLNDQVRRRATVERIFVLSKSSRPLKPAHVEALLDQIRRRFIVRVVFQEDLEEEDPATLDLGIFDDFAVSYWKMSGGRVFRVETAPERVLAAQQLFARVARRCRAVSKNSQDRRRFEDEAELLDWVRREGS